MSIVIRDARPADRPIVVAFMAELQAFERTLCANRADAASMAAGHTEYLFAEIAAKDGFCLIAEDAGAPAGFLIGMSDAPPDGDLHIREDMRRIGYVTDVFVSPENRGRGLARALLAEAEARFRARGLPVMEICFLAGNDGARKSYEAFGFAPYEVVYAKPLGD
ncbi:MAG: GNAT family N-acetyltransferase [Rhodospirillales bacterium]